MWNKSRTSTSTGAVSCSPSSDSLLSFCDPGTSSVSLTIILSPLLPRSTRDAPRSTCRAAGASPSDEGSSDSSDSPAGEAATTLALLSSCAPKNHCLVHARVFHSRPASRSSRSSFSWSPWCTTTTRDYLKLHVLECWLFVFLSQTMLFRRREGDNTYFCDKNTKFDHESIFEKRFVL